MVKYLIQNFAYHIWLINDSLSGYLGSGSRNVCYYVTNRNTADYGYIDRFFYHLDRTATCERVGHYFYSSKYASPLTLGAMVVGVGYYCNYLYQHRQYLNYRSKDDNDLNALSEGMKTAFLKGVAVAKNGPIKRMFTTMFDWNCWRHGNAYFAGVEAGKNITISTNQSLIDGIRTRLAS